MGENRQPMIKSQHNSAHFQRRGAPVASSMRMRIIGVSRSTLVPLDQPAEPFVADNLIEHDRLIFPWRIGARRRQEIADRIRFK